MTEIEIYQKLAPYFDVHIDYTDPEKTFNEFIKQSKELREKLRQKFDIEAFIKTPGNYSKCFSLEIYFDGENLPINPRPSIEGFIYQHKIEIDISAIAPFCTYAIRLSPTDNEHVRVTNKIAARSASNDHLWLFADDCINWLCETENINYIPFNALQEEVPERFDLATLQKSTLYSVIFTEE